MNQKIILSIIFISIGFSINRSVLLESADIVLGAFGDHPINSKYNWRDLTPALFEIRQNGYLLEHSVKQELESAGFHFSGTAVSRIINGRSEADGLDRFYDFGIFRFHFTTTGNHGVDETDDNSNSVPDYIDSMAETFVHVYNKQINEMGYYRPPDDESIKEYLSVDYDYGGSDHYDIYVRKLSSSYYGYVWSEYDVGNNLYSPDLDEQNAFTSYMAMRNNYDGFPNTEVENIQVTASHEFFHAIQYGYDGYEKPWLLEATAVWIEEEIYDDINDCYQYMNSWFNEPQKSLDYVGGTHWYGSWIFFEYIDEHLGGPGTIKNIFIEGVSSNSEHNDYSQMAIDDALSLENSSFEEALNGMAIANIIMSSYPGPESDMYSYEEAEDFPVDAPRIYETVHFNEDEIEYISSTILNRFGSQYVKIDTEIPVLLTLDTLNHDLPKFGFHSVAKFHDGSFIITSGDSLFISSELIESDEIYTVIVSEDKDSYNFDYQLKIEIANTPPEPFIIESPVFNSRISTQFPQFNWSVSEDNNPMDSVFYVLEFGKNIENLDVIYEGKNPFFIPSNPYNKNIIYYWQVYAYDLGDNKTYNSNGIHRFLIRTSSPKQDVMLTSVYPNPFPSINPAINSIRFSIFLEKEETIKVFVTDLLGRKVTEIYDGLLSPGFHDHMSWNSRTNTGNEAPSGIYYFTIETSHDVKNHKITLIR